MSKSNRSYRREEPTEDEIFAMRKEQLMVAKTIAFTTLKTDDPEIVFEISGYLSDDADEVRALVATALVTSVAVFGEEKGRVPATVMGVLDVLTDEGDDGDDE